ncbi:hypothetical protein [Clostridium baratii]|uniref:Uncharacterized protein n=1 Tax=Clostridium baratii TaxID=1561 RepID=A0A174VAH6_9CLOT|nr:hypothetical protein [Clostridium baratii]CUQ30151.1 Uncharacterised protein [Clostridium baratii]
MAKSKVDLKSKELAQAILQCSGIDYEDWLNEKHKELILNNSNVLVEALALKNEMENESN